MELVKTWRNRVKSVSLVLTQRVDNGPVTKNIQDGPAVDLLQFPAPLWHQEDGGRYLGTGSLTITRECKNLSSRSMGVTSLVFTFLESSMVVGTWKSIGPVGGPAQLSYHSGKTRCYF